MAAIKKSQTCFLTNTDRYDPNIIPNKTQHHLSSIISIGDQVFVLKSFILLSSQYRWFWLDLWCKYWAKLKLINNEINLPVLPPSKNSYLQIIPWTRHLSPPELPIPKGIHQPHLTIIKLFMFILWTNRVVLVRLSEQSYGSSPWSPHCWRIFISTL